MLSLMADITLVRSVPKTIIVPDDYPTIQEAINAAISGDTIYVKAGTYFENLVINKTISLIGENADNTIIDGMGKDNVILIVTDNVIIKKFTITNSKNQAGYAGIYSRNTKNCSIRENIISSNWRGICLYNCNDYVIQCNTITNTTESLAIWLEHTNNTIISSNIISNNPSGVNLEYSNNNVVCRNRITNNEYYGLSLTESNMNLVIENIIENNSEWYGIALWWSSHNTITANNILSNWCGLRFGFSPSNMIYHNNFINNTIQAYDTYKDYDSKPSINSWDNGYPSGGNYWSDYNGTDFYSGSHQNMVGSDGIGDGIGDSPYVIDGNNVDRYPVMKPYSWGAYDVEVARIILSKTVVGQEYNLYVNANVTIFNYSNCTEDFRLDIYVNSSLARSFSGVLVSENFTIIGFSLNVTGLAKGIYNVTAYLQPIQNETDTSDNIYTIWVYVTIAGDITSITPEVPDYRVDMRDIGALCSKFMATPSSPEWNPNYDINNDNIINMRDIGIACSNYMKET